MKVRNVTILFVIIALLTAVFAGCAASQPQINSTTAAPTTTNAPTTAATTVPETTAVPTTVPSAAYVYPVLPGTDAWNALGSHAEMLAVCQIPEDILCRLTTKALLETVLDYPLMGDMHAYSTMELGFLRVRDQFNGLQELVSRPDAGAVTDAFSFAGTRWEEESLVVGAFNAIVKYGLTYYIEEVYVYSITTGTDAELIAAYQVPEELLRHMTDYCLVSTVANHPLITRVLEDGFDQAAYDALCESINCLGELENRSNTIGLTIIGHMGDPTGIAEYALEYYSDVLGVIYDMRGN